MSEKTDAAMRRPRVVGLNHIALEVGDVDAALAFYGRIFSFALRGRQPGAAFIDMGDQFIAMMQWPVRAERSRRHFRLVVDDRTLVRQCESAAGAVTLVRSR